MFLQDSDAALCVRCKQATTSGPASPDNKQVKMLQKFSIWF